MARFGRGQPHGPIFLRAPLVAAIVATATVSPIHVVLADSHRPPASHVYIVRPSRASLVPDRLAPQIHVISVAAERNLRRPVRLIIQRAPQAPAVVSARAAPLHVVLARRGLRPGTTPIIFAHNGTIAQEAGPARPQVRVISLTGLRRAPRPDGLVLYVRPSVASLVPDRLPPQIHVLGQNRRRADGASLVVLLRNPQAPVIAAAKLAPQIHVVSLTVLRRAVRPDGSVLYLRPSRSSLVPDKLAPQIHVISRVGDRQRVRREPVLFYQHPSLAAPLQALALGVTDLGDYRYAVADDGHSVLALTDADLLRYVCYDASSHRLYVVDQSGLRYWVSDI